MARQKDAGHQLPALSEILSKLDGINDARPDRDTYCRLSADRHLLVSLHLQFSLQVPQRVFPLRWSLPVLVLKSADLLVVPEGPMNAV